MDGLIYMDAEITPNRSLSQRGFIVLISVLTALHCVSAVVFVMMGALLVPIFLGLDVAAVALAFTASYAGAKRIERVLVTARQVRVSHETPKWSRVVWESPTAFTRVALENDEDEVDLRLALSGREVAVAQALSPSERTAFGHALKEAIYRARSERS
jgi:uncharacterized membrane protein